MLRSHNVDPNAEFAKRHWVHTIALAAGTTLATVSQAILNLPFRAKIESVDVVTTQTSSASTVDVTEGGTSILSAAITAATTASTKVSGTVSDSDIAAGANIIVALTRGNEDACYYSVIVGYRPYLGVQERDGKSLGRTS